MKAFGTFVTGARTCTLALVAVVVVGLAMLPTAASAGTGPGTWTQADINASIDKALAYLDTQQNPDGSYGTSDPGAESALALGAYGVKGYANLPPAEQTQVQNGIKYLLSTQQPDGSFAGDGFFLTYDTGTALIALSLLGDVPTTPAGAIPTAIASARQYLVGAQNSPPQVSCQSTGTNGSGLGGQNFCGGWDYGAPGSRSDESNTGFALTGLELTGGVPTDVASIDVGWQQNVQQLTSNPGGFSARNDGGGAYEPGDSSGDFSSNANENGTLTFGYGFDKVPATDPGVQAAIKMSNDTLDTYETPGARANRTMVFHTGMDENGSCDPAVSGCDWSFGSFEGGYHYSLFALVKGLSQYIAPALSDPTNFFAKAVDLLLSQQASDGSWPFDPRDDGSVIGATAFSVLALGRVGAPADPAITATGTAVSSTEGKPFSGTVATFTDPDTTATASEYSATIDWGDGSTSPGTISGTGGNFTVSGGHTYVEDGSYTVKVTITDVDNTPNTATTSNTATVADAALTAAGATVNPVEGASTAQTVATFTDANPGGTVSDFTATINWGDGTTSAGTVAKSGSGFVVTGSHAYAEEGSDTITVAIKDVGGSTASATSSAKVADAALHATARTITRVQGAIEGHLMRPTVATFTDADPGGKVSDYTATINWGDGATTAGKIAASGKAFSVSGSHIYAEEGTHKITVTIKDAGGATTSTTSTAKVADAPLHGFSTRQVLRGNFSGTIARFTDSDPGGKLSDYTATINWGDGKKTAGAISRGATFKVGGGHRFQKPGVYHVTITIKDAGGSRVTVHSLVVIVSPGSATISTPAACVASSFAAELRGKQIAVVTYTFDGSDIRVTVVHGGTLYRAVITVPPGRHHLTVKVTFRKASGTTSRTLNRTVTGCLPVPNFTG